MTRMKLLMSMIFLFFWHVMLKSVSVLPFSSILSSTTASTESRSSSSSLTHIQLDVIGVGNLPSLALTGWYLSSLHRHKTRVPTSRGSTDDLRRFDVLDRSAASAPSKDWYLPLPDGIWIEAMGWEWKMTWKNCREENAYFYLNSSTQYQFLNHYLFLSLAF